MHSRRFLGFLVALQLLIFVPASAQMGRVLTDFPNENAVENINGFEVKVLPPDEGIREKLMEEFQLLTPEQYQRFFAARTWLLGVASGLVKAGRVVIGTGIRLTDEGGGAIHFGEATEEILQPETHRQKVTLAELGQPYVAGFLNSINTLIWQQHRVFADGNEKGLSVLLATGIGLGLRGENRLSTALRQRLGGKRPYIVLGLAVNFGANWERKELFLEVTTHHETLKEVHTMVSEAYVGVKPTPYIRSMPPGGEMKVRRGEGYYGGMFGSILRSASYLTAGITYCAGYPTFPWGGAAVMETEWTNIPIFRLSLYPTSWRFIGIKDAFSARLIDYVKRRVYERQNPGQCGTRLT